jgi:hypothetical protein
MYVLLLFFCSIIYCFSHFLGETTKETFFDRLLSMSPSFDPRNPKTSPIPPPLMSIRLVIYAEVMHFHINAPTSTRVF